jgi:hypothetical protein
MLAVERTYRRREQLPRERLLRPEGGGERSAETVEHFEPHRRLLIDDVRVG